MKKLKFNKGVFILAITLFTNSVLFGQNAIKIVPKTENAKIVITGNRSYDYYALNEEKAVKVKIKGPGELIMYTRVLLDKDKKKSSDFILKYTKDKKNAQVRNVNTLSIDPTVKAADKTATVENKMVINVPPGNHNYLFFKKGSTEAIYSHYAFKKGAKMHWNETASKDNLEKVILTSINKKKANIYYRINQKQAFTRQAKPGDYLRVMLRSESNKTELKSVNTKISLSVDGKVVKKYTLRSKQTSKMVCKSDAEKIPGTLREIYLRIPKKSKKESVTYQIAVLENNRNVLVRMNTCSDYQFIAKKDHEVTALSKKKTLETTPEKGSKKM